MKKILVVKDSYFDSVFLMSINHEIKKLDGIKEAVVSMGTEMNIKLLREIDLSNDEVAQCGPNDLIIAIWGETEAIAEDAEQVAWKLLKAQQVDDGHKETAPTTLDMAVKRYSDANMAIISVLLPFRRIRYEQPCRSKSMR